MKKKNYAEKENENTDAFKMSRREKLYSEDNISEISQFNDLSDDASLTISDNLDEDKNWKLTDQK